MLGVVYMEGSRLTALGEVLLSCHNSIYRYARALSHDPALAEELVQETYKRALAAKRRPNPLTAGNVRPWAFTILRNIWQNTLRHNEHAGIGEPLDHEIADPGFEPMEAVLTRQLLRSEIVQAIDALPAGFREVVILREIEGLTYVEISEVLSCPRGTVMSRLARARHLLRGMLMRFALSGQEIER
jgi:RNA polymerase sigma-70 factor, ECF subfamily